MEENDHVVKNRTKCRQWLDLYWKMTHLDGHMRYGGGMWPMELVVENGSSVPSLAICLL